MGGHGSRLGFLHASERADTRTSRKRGDIPDSSNAWIEQFVNCARKFCHTARDAVPCISGFATETNSRISRLDVSFVARGRNLSSYSLIPWVICGLVWRQCNPPLATSSICSWQMLTLGESFCVFWSSI